MRCYSDRFSKRLQYLVRGANHQTRECAASERRNRSAHVALWHGSVEDALVHTAAAFRSLGVLGLRAVQAHISRSLLKIGSLLFPQEKKFSKSRPRYEAHFRTLTMILRYIKL